ncbi:monooxygenase [Pseudonocardia sulfidoxydans NBRC 16205]|uniref:Monooxygenase n=1 Tax=Pseudonocardia sulfidoxydans NBRC 16205 TaxID=1223511 RepID=A0A511DC92_9PSEU|nr:FAD-dependent monooxygenase [Pseudonocardia sulfidoxydans]GEL22412.1 monooxygenase [Pseudonocardia sulfidoxydans NBRC 16205]
MARHIHSVVIAGGGLGGLSAAYFLRMAGIRVTVLEQADEFGEVGAGIQTAPNASRILIENGLRPQLEAIKTSPTFQVRRRWSDGSILGIRPLGDAVWREHGAPYWHFHRADLHRVLLDACADPATPGPDVHLCTSARVKSVDQSVGEQPAVVTEDGRRFEADVVIGADGVRSQVREEIMGSDDLRFSGQMVFRVMVPGESLMKDPATRFLWDSFHSTMWLGPRLHLVHYFIRGGEYLNLGAALQSDIPLHDGWTVDTTVDELVAALATWDSRLTSILKKVEEPVAKWALFAHRRNPVWVDGHVALLGDAAHAMVPFQAQGASQAIEDAHVLARELSVVDKGGIEAALIRYAARRYRRAGLVQEASAQNRNFYQMPDGPEQVARDEKLRNFQGESHISYDWLWSGSEEPMSSGYAFANGGQSAIASWQKG